MEDTIYRQEALEGLYDVFFDDELSAAYPKEADKVLDVIRKLPSAQPERKKAKWLDSQGKEKYVGYCAECSACGGWSEYITDFCPNCGARMDRGESE